MSNSLWPHGLQHTRLPCPSPSPRVHENSCPLSQWCHPTISSSVVPFSSDLQSFPASGSFPLSWLFASGGQSIGASASASVLPMNIQDWFSLGLTGWISLLSKGLSRIFSSTTVQIPVDGIIIYPIAHFSNLGCMFNIASSFPFSYEIHYWVLMLLSHWSSVPTTLTHAITIPWLDYWLNLSTGDHASPVVSLQSSLYCSRFWWSLFCLNDFL